MMQISEPACVSHRATEGRWEGWDRTLSSLRHLKKKTQNPDGVIKSEVTAGFVYVCEHIMVPYMVLVRHCCLDERGWSSSGRWNVNVSEESEPGSSLQWCSHSSVSPRRWLYRETERKTPSEEEEKSKTSWHVGVKVTPLFLSMW